MQPRRRSPLAVVLMAASVNGLAGGAFAQEQSPEALAFPHFFERAGSAASSSFAFDTVIRLF